MLISVLVVVLLGGPLAYYFLVYKKKGSTGATPATGKASRGGSRKDYDLLVAQARKCDGQRVQVARDQGEGIGRKLYVVAPPSLGLPGKFIDDPDPSGRTQVRAELVMRFNEVPFGPNWKKTDVYAFLTFEKPPLLVA